MAVPLVAGGELLGVLELVHGEKEAPLGEGARRVFHDGAGRLGRRLQAVLASGPHAGPYDFLVRTGWVSPEALVEAREQAAKEKRSVEDILAALERGLDPPTPTPGTLPAGGSVPEPVPVPEGPDRPPAPPLRLRSRTAARPTPRRSAWWTR